MSFTLWSPPSLTPAQSGAIPDIIGNILRGYTGVVGAKYLPKEKESQIFANQIGPLATLATSPMFLQNPQFQQALSNLISKNSHLLGPGFEGIGGRSGSGSGSRGSGGAGGNYPDTYAGNVGKRVNEAGNLAQDLSSAGAAQTGLSGIAGWIENNFGDLGKTILNNITKGKVNSGLAQKENEFQTYMLGMKKNAIDTQALTPQDANDVFTKRKNENDLAWWNRVRRSVPNLFMQNENNPPRNIDEKIARDEQERMQYQIEHNGQNTNQGNDETIDENNKFFNSALDVSDQIFKRTGKSISEQKIMKYMRKHPGKINMKKMLQVIGE